MSERASLIAARPEERVYIPIKVGCGCVLHFGPTLDNGINQPLREVCRHRTLWAGTYLAKTREAIVGRVVSVRADETSYAVEPETWEEMYASRFGSSPQNDHGRLL